jgi:hypothetical protein
VVNLNRERLMSRSNSVAGAAALGCLLSLGCGHAAEVWTKAPPDYRKLGVRLLVCKDIREELICLGLGCAGGQSELISIRSGSGAFSGAVRIDAPPKSVQASFSNNDDDLATLAGASASRAAISPQIVQSMLDAPRIKIHDAREAGFSETYSTRGLKRHLQAGDLLCQKP